MAISFDKALGIHEHALNTRVKRAAVLANNLVNADTPGFKARDIDFQSVMARAEQGRSGTKMESTHPAHFGGTISSGREQLLYRTPHQPSIDGNTVDAQQEQSRFMRNAMDYQASFQFLNSKFTGLSKAIKGD